MSYEVNFTNLSEGGNGHSIIGYEWNFGDGSVINTDKSPVHRWKHGSPNSNN